VRKLFISSFAESAVLMLVIIMAGMIAVSCSSSAATPTPAHDFNSQGFQQQTGAQPINNSDLGHVVYIPIVNGDLEELLREVNSWISINQHEREIITVQIANNDWTWALNRGWSTPSGAVIIHLPKE